MTAGELIKALSALPPNTPVAVAYDDAPEYATEVDGGEVENRSTTGGDYDVFILTYSQSSEVYEDKEVTREED